MISQAPEPNPREYVYLIQVKDTDDFKIGRTESNPGDRLQQLQVGKLYKLELRGVIETAQSRLQEEELHQQFASYRVEGEWFSFPAIVVQQVIELFDQIDPTSQQG